MTTLVTGAGLIGTAFAVLAQARGERVIFVDRDPRPDYVAFKLGRDDATIITHDIRDLDGLVATMVAHKVDTVVHTAGLIGGQVQKDLSVGFDINLGGTRNIAEAVRRGGVKRLVYLSTFGVYDQRCMPTHPIDEGAAKGGTRGYGNFKVAQELVLEAYAAQYQFELVMLRPANVFGFGYFLAGSSGGAKMQALLEAGLDGRCARIPSTEALANEYVYAKDVGRAVDLAALARLNGIGIYNIGTGVVTPFSQLVETVTVLLPGLTVDVEPGAPAKSKSQPLDIGLAKRHLGWVPQYGLRGALEDYLSEIKLVRAVRSSGVKL